MNLIMAIHAAMIHFTVIIYLDLRFSYGFIVALFAVDSCGGRSATDSKKKTEQTRRNVLILINLIPILMISIINKN